MIVRLLIPRFHGLRKRKQNGFGLFQGVDGPLIAQHAADARSH